MCLNSICVRTLLSKHVDSRNSLLRELQKEAVRLEKVVRSTKDRRKRILTLREYDKLISRIEAIKNPTIIELMRYE
jgi:hypothetical protein